MAKIVYNACYGGFGLSIKASERIAELKGDVLTESDFSNIFGRHCNKYRDIERTDPALVQSIEELGIEANSDFADLQIAEVPSGTLYRIDEYDGNESVMTQSDYDWKIA